MGNEREPYTMGYGSASTFIMSLRMGKTRNAAGVYPRHTLYGQKISPRDSAVQQMFQDYS